MEEKKRAKRISAQTMRLFKIRRPKEAMIPSEKRDVVGGAPRKRGKKNQRTDATSSQAKEHFEESNEGRS